MQADADGRLAWDWTPDVWRWNPAQERWSDDHGRPADVAGLSVSTRGLAGAEAFDFWCGTAMAEGFEPVRRADPRASFGGDARGLLDGRAEFFACRLSALSGRRPAPRGVETDWPFLAIGLMDAGRCVHGGADGGGRAAGPGGFFVCDSARPVRIAWSDHDACHLNLDRAEAEAAFGGRMPDAVLIASALEGSGLAPFLKAHMRLLAGTMDALSRFERAAALDQLADLALAALRGLTGAAAEADDSARGWVYPAAMRAIGMRLGEERFGPAALAAALGCSRATLYRAFAERGETVAAAIRRMRLDRARAMIARVPDGTSVAMIAARAGFSDTRTFNRAFRARFGMAPGDARPRPPGRPRT